VNGRCFDIGITTSRALHRFLDNRDAARSGSQAESASGNGSIMRLAPVPIRYHDLYPARILELARLAEESSLTTHASEQCLSACRYLALLISALIHGEDRAAVLSPTWQPLQELHAARPLHPLILAIAGASFKDRTRSSIRASGWVVHCLEAALWAFHDAGNFEEAVLKAVNLGEDADTTGAVCGQLAGAFWGESGIPESLRQGLAKFEMIDAALGGLLASRDDGRK
jgi:ADP-ribosylglycohydrolase